MTLAQLRALLDRALHTTGPTPPHISRLGQSVTVEDLARAYLPFAVSVVPTLPAESALFWPDGSIGRQWDGRALNMYDPGTVHAIKVALALALGLDPGPMGCAVAWRQDATGYRLDGATSQMGQRATAWLVPFDPGVDHSNHDHDGALWVHAPTVATEPDAVRALVLAVEHVLGAA